MEIDRHFIKDKIELWMLELTYTLTNSQVDILMKAVKRIKLEELSSKLRMINIYSPAFREVLEFTRFLPLLIPSTVYCGLMF